MSPHLRCQEHELPIFARRYQYLLEETTVLNLRPRILDRGWMTKDELRTISRWKAPRSAGHVEDNPEEYVKEITEFAFKATTERARIEILTILLAADPTWFLIGCESPALRATKQTNR